ncbi:hypothetical protein Pan241w_29630 [Gimesia alba]|uniref:Uncharacterized protein n=1 Tax=Gimesia alba TaxID=2527973 RepID=A0A517RG74_9PLAN|nr:hypothetical protein [Gimesia alba]QDT42868.1 hypothetical protein Pan241w_29630 [Gimesia alba]
MLKNNPLVSKILRRTSYFLISLGVLYLLSVGPVVAICRQLVKNPWTIPPGLSTIERFYSPLFAVPWITPLIELYINLWEKILG